MLQIFLGILGTRIIRTEILGNLGSGIFFIETILVPIFEYRITHKPNYPNRNNQNTQTPRLNHIKCIQATMVNCKQELAEPHPAASQTGGQAGRLTRWRFPSQSVEEESELTALRRRGGALCRRHAELHVVLDRPATRRWPHFRASLAVLQVQTTSALGLYGSGLTACAPNFMRKGDSGSLCGRSRFAGDSIPVCLSAGRRPALRG